MADMLVTPEELASYLQADQLDRATAELVIQTATGTVQATCRQRLVQGTSTVTLLGEPGPWLDLPERPVTAVTAVLVSSAPVTDWTLVTDPRTGAGRLWRGFGWTGYAQTFGSAWTGPRQVTVTYQHGYPAAHPGLELARSAVLMLASAGFRNPDGLRAETIDDYQVSYADTASQPVLTPELRAELRRQYGVTAGSVALTAG